MAIGFNLQSGDFALRLPVIRPIEREYGSATSGANEAAPARSLFGTKESGGEDRARPARSAQTDKSETEEAGASGWRGVAFLRSLAALPRQSARRVSHR
jgi:hypothetical protein